MAFAIPLAVAAIGGAASYFGGQATNATNIAISQAQMQFQAQQQANQQAFNGEQSWLAYLRNNQTIANAQAYDSDQAAIQRNFNSGMMQQAEGFDAQQAQIQRDYETGMSNTAYQRSVADMKAAGLNPILGVASGGASTPSVSAPTVNPASASAPTSPTLGAPAASTVAMPGATTRVSNALGEGINSAFQAMRTVNDLRQTAAQVDYTQAQTDAVKAQTPGMAADSLTKGLGPDIAKAGLAKTEAEIQNIIQMRTNLDAQSAASLASAIASRAAAGLSGAQTGQVDAVTQYLRDNGMLPGTSKIPDVHSAVSSLGNAATSAYDGVESFLSNLAKSASSWLAPGGHSARSVGPPPPRSYAAPPFGGF